MAVAGSDAFLDSALTRIAGHFQVVQWHPICKNIELDAANCVEAYGFFRGQEKCKELLQDVFECVYNVKQNRRLELMHLEYLRQVKKGNKEFIPVPRVPYYYA